VERNDWQIRLGQMGSDEGVERIATLYGKVMDILSFGECHLNSVIKKIGKID
jgi:hypothetical protein